MILDDDERAELPRRLFALAGRRLERACGHAVAGEAYAVAPAKLAALSGELHDAGQDLQVIADAIAVLVEREAAR